VTRQLLWREYREAHPDGYGYSQFCEHFRRWLSARHPTMRQRHCAGEGYVDYAGLTMPVIEPESGELQEAEIFVYALGASDYIYAEGQWAQDTASWIGGHINAFEHFGGVPPITVPDNLKSGVTHPCRYDPDLNRAYHDFAVYYGTAVVPARVGKYRDKAKVEQAVQVVERDVLAPLRNVRFVGLAALNEAMRERLHVVNHRPMRYYDRSRAELFETIDRPALLPLPERPFVLGTWKLAKVAIDYHVEFDAHFYSVPYQLIGQHVEIRATQDTIEIFSAGQRVASHVRSRQRGSHSTMDSHMPDRHRAYAEWTPERIASWASRIGPETTAAVSILMASRAHPQQAFRSALGVIRLADRYSAPRLDAACRYAIDLEAVRYKTIKHILAAGLDQAAAQVEDDRPTAAHANVRGADSYH
jgi:transposase